MSKDACLVLSKAKRCHLSGCGIVTSGLDAVNDLLESGIPTFEKAKVLVIFEFNLMTL